MGIRSEHVLKYTIKAGRCGDRTQAQAHQVPSRYPQGYPLHAASHQPMEEAGWIAQGSSLGPAMLSSWGQRSGLGRKHARQLRHLLSTTPLGKAVSHGYSRQHLKGCTNSKSEFSLSVYWLNINKMQVAWQSRYRCRTVRDVTTA